MRNREAVPVMPLADYVALGERLLLIAALPIIGIAGGLLIITARRSPVVATILVMMVLLNSVRELAVLLSTGMIFPQWLRAEFTADAAIVVLGIILIRFVTRSDDRSIAGARNPSTRGDLLAVGVLFLIAVTTAFGSGNGFMRQTALAAGILVAAMIVAATAQRDRAARLAALALLVVIVLPTSVLHVIGNRLRPYEMNPIDQQTVLTAVGRDGASLRLDPAMADFLGDIVTHAEVEGWQPGTPALGVPHPATPAVLWHLGARVPDSLLLSWGDMATSDDRFEANLARHVDNDFREAWLIVSGTSHPAHDMLRDQAVRAAAAVGLDFPRDYRRIFSTASPAQSQWMVRYGNVEVWRPVLR